MARIVGLLSLALLIAASAAAPTPLEQTVLAADYIEILDSEERILRVNTTFDAIELSNDEPVEKLESYGYLQFEGYKIFDPKAAAANDLLNISDIDCAVSSPNALLLLPGEHDAPFVFRTNASALGAANVSQYFDFISVAIKPLALNSSWVWAEMNAWTIKDGSAENVQTIDMGFGTDDGSFIPSILEPRRYITGWGEKANFIEFKGEDDQGNPAAFCLDNIVLDFHKPYDDE